MEYWLYHKVPENIFGETIYPLNVLKEIKPEIYQQAVQKYVGRESLLSRKVPSLDCLWNDVIFLIAVHPSKINEAIENAELRSPRDFGYSYFKINLSMLDQSLLATFIHLKDDSLVFSEFDPTKMGEYATISETQLEYYKEKRKEKHPWYLFASRTTHILYRSEINVAGLEIITL